MKINPILSVIFLAVFLFAGTQIENRNRMIGLKLVYSSSNLGWLVPHTPKNLFVYINGLREEKDVDFTLTGNKITLIGVNKDLIPAETVILVDYEY